jgi:CBS domain-containing protein
MRARDLMSAPVITVRSETTVKDALTLLTENGFTALPVVDTDARLVGIVTEADLIHDRVLRDPRDCRGAVDAGRRDSAQDTVGAVMTSPAIAMEPGADLTDLCQALVDARIRAMPIVDGGKVVGVVTRGDIVRVLARDDRSIAADVRHRLEIYGGLNRWKVEVHDGVVRIVDAFDSNTDRHVATVLARAVPGVLHAGTVSTASSGNGRAG